MSLGSNLQPHRLSSHAHGLVFCCFCLEILLNQGPCIFILHCVLKSIYLVLGTGQVLTDRWRRGGGSDYRGRAGWVLCGGQGRVGNSIGEGEEIPQLRRSFPQGVIGLQSQECASVGGAPGDPTLALNSLT